MPKLVLRHHGWEVWSISLWRTYFMGPWVRIQAGNINMSLIFSIQTFCIFFSLIWVMHNYGGVHKLCGPSKTRGRDCLAAYEINQFDVPKLVNWKITSKENKMVLRMKIVTLAKNHIPQKIHWEDTSKIIMAEKKS